MPSRPRLVPARFVPARFVPVRFVPALLVLMGGCDAYNPPPEPNLPLPKAGIWEVGESLEINFTEPITPQSLVINVWPAGPEARDIEGEFLPGVVPALGDCRPGACGQSTLTVTPDGLRATLTLREAVFGKAKVPWILEVAPGLADPSGKRTGAPWWFDFQFAPSNDPGGATDIAFDSGRYALFSQLDQPVKVALNLFMDVAALPDGQVRIAGGKATTNDGAPKNTQDITDLHVDLSDKGFAVFLKGQITRDELTGERFLSTAAVDLKLAIGPIRVTLAELRLTGTIPTDRATGQDQVEGTISYSKLILDFGSGEPFVYEPDNATFSMRAIPDALAFPEAPVLCGALCGEIPQQCEPPEGFTEGGFCPAPTP